MRRLVSERRKNTTFRMKEEQTLLRIPFDITIEKTMLTRLISSRPFVPQQQEERARRCEEILTIQAMGLKKRLAHTNAKSAVVGISGGLDSTLALLVTAKAFDALGLDRSGITAVTMPCFGTTAVSYTHLDEPEEFYKLMELYNKYPLEELIVHPRTQKDFYRNTPNLSMFGYAVEQSRFPLCYNGDVKKRENKENIVETFPGISAIMLGRGVIANPFLTASFEKPEEQNEIDKDTLRNFHDALYEGYGQVSDGILPVLFKMKEIWTYMKELFPEDKKRIKKLKKAENAKDYEQAVVELFALL